MATATACSIPQLNLANAGDYFIDSSLGRSSHGSTTPRLAAASTTSTSNHFSAAVAAAVPKLIKISRGRRFEGDKVEIFLYVERSLNKNIVVYESIMEHAKVQQNGANDLSSVGLRLNEPVRAYWLEIDPAYVEKKRKKGILSDVEELNFIEKKMAYGLTAILESPESSVTVDPSGRRLNQHILVPSVMTSVRSNYNFTLHFAALPTRGMRLVLLQVQLTTAHGTTELTVVPVVECIVDGMRSVLERVYVATSTSTFRTSPDFVDLFGLSVEEASFGQSTSERVTY